MISHFGTSISFASIKSIARVHSPVYVLERLDGLMRPNSHLLASLDIPSTLFVSMDDFLKMVELGVFH